MLVYRAEGLTAGTGLVNAGKLSFKKGATTVGGMLVGANVTEMAVMTIPHFTADGLPIRGAWLHGWSGAMAKKTTETATLALKIKKPSELFVIRTRHTIAQAESINHVFEMPIYLSPGTQIELAALAVGATDQEVSGGFSLKYEV